MSRRLKFVAVVVAIAMIAALAVFLFWRSGEASRGQRALGDRLAASLTSLTLDADDFVAGSLVPADELAEIVRGLGALKPTVTVLGVAERDAATSEVTLHWEWTPMAHREGWSYDTTVPVRGTPDGWRATWSASVVAPGLKDSERLLVNRLKATRGEILGQGGAQLAYNQPAMRVGIDKSGLDAAQWDASARKLAAAVAAGGVSVDADAYAKSVAAAGPKAYVEAAILRLNDDRQKAASDATKLISGVLRQQVSRPLGITSSFLRPILGAVGEATADAVAKGGGEVVAGDLVGTAGLQAARDEVLRGRSGYVVQAIQRGGSTARDLKRVSATDGASVQTTVDVGLQQAAESILAGIGPASAIVAIRPSDGQILVAASGPGSNGYSTATLGQYPPGSTFKTVTGLAMIRHGMTPSSTITCTPSITVDGYTFDNFEGYPTGLLGDGPWLTAFANSCNTAVISQSTTVAQADLASAADALGLTATPNLIVPAVLGSVPSTAGSATEHAASMIGQGKVLTTPLGMAVVAASIAKGAVVRPTLVVGEHGSTVSPAADPGVPLTAQETEYLKTLMGAVVTQGGAQTALAGTPGGTILAKTGTSTYTNNGAKAYHTWILGIQGDLAVAVFVADGASGAKTSGPLLKAFLTAVAKG